MVQEILIRQDDELIDALEVAMMEAALDDNSNVAFADCPVIHDFFPNLYVRTILMAAGVTITSKIHKTCHPFRVIEGIVHVKIDNGEWERIEAPYRGVTKAGTRRVLRIEKDAVWETFHSLPFITGCENDLSDEEKEQVLQRIEDGILDPYQNKLVGAIVTRNTLKYTENENGFLT